MCSPPRHLYLSWLALAAAALSGCSGESTTCKTHASRTCERGALYWVNSCGHLEEIDTYCICGCGDDHASCRTDCGCTCSEPGPCCDGCMPVAEGLACDDGDPDTLADVCRAGVCAGFAPGALAQAALPEEPAAPTAAAPAADVQLASWACPANWEPVAHAELLDLDDDPFSWCQPPPLPRLKLGAYVTPLKEGEQDGDRPVCEPAADGTYPVVGHTDCQPLGDACPGGEWPEVPADVPGARIHVRAGASGGDGSAAAPFGTIAAAIDAAADGDVIVIAAGAYPETLTIGKTLTLWGKCVRETVIAPPGPFDPATAAVQLGQDLQVEIRNLLITGEQQGALVDATGAGLTLRGVWIHEAAGNAVSVLRGTVHLSGCLVTASRTAGDFYGLGLRTTAGAQVDIQASTFEQNRDVAFSSYGADTELTAVDVASRENLPREASGDYGMGMEALHGARATVTRALFDGNRHVGILSGHEGSQLHLENVAILDTRPNEISGMYGWGLSTEEGASTTLRNVLCQGAHSVGLVALGGSALLDAENLVVSSIRPRASDGFLGQGMSVWGGAEARFTGALFEDNHEAAIVMFDEGTRITLDDTVVMNTNAIPASGASGFGLYLSGGDFDMHRGLVAYNRTAAIYATDDAVVDLEDITVRDTRAQESDDRYGQGLDVNNRAQVAVRRGRFVGNRTSAIVAIRVGTRLTLEDVIVRDTLSRASDQTGGRGLDAAAGAEIVLRRVSFANNRDVGMYVRGADTVLDAEDVIVTGTLASEHNQQFGYGMEIGLGAQATVTRAVFDQNRSLGLFVLGEDTRALFTDLVVRDTQEDASDQMWGRGIEVNGGARTEIRRALFEGNRDFGVFTGQPDTVLVLEDATIRDTRSRALDGGYGIGLEATSEARLEGSRILLERNRLLGLAVISPDTQAILEDVTVRDTLPVEDPDTPDAFGGGVAVIEGAHLTLVRGLLEQNRMVGLLATDDHPTVVLEDLVIRDTRSQESDGTFGWGLAAQLGAEVSLVRGLLDGNREVAANCLGEGARLELTHVLATNTRASSCVEQQDPACEEHPRGLGLGVYLEGRTTIDGVVTDSSDLVGIQIAEGGSLSGRALTVQNNPIGVNIQDPAEDYSFFGQVSGLRMDANGVNFDGSDLPIPDPLSVLQ